MVGNGARRPFQRDWKGVWMPRSLWAARGLSAEDRMILAEIFYLSRGSEGCWATDAHFGELLEAEARTVQRRIEKLELLGVVLVSWHAGRQRRLFLNSELGDGGLEDVMRLFAEGLADVWPVLDTEKEREREQRRRACVATPLPSDLSEEAVSSNLTEGTGLPTNLTGLPSDLSEGGAWPSDKSDANGGHSLESEKHVYNKKQQQRVGAGPRARPLLAPLSGRKAGVLGEGGISVCLAWNDAALAAEAERREAQAEQPSVLPLVCGCPKEKAAVKAAAASLNINQGDGDGDGDGDWAEEPEEDEAPLSPAQVAAVFYDLIGRQQEIRDVLVTWAFDRLGMERAVGEALLEAHDPAIIGYWIAKCGDKNNPAGFIRGQLTKNAPREPLPEIKRTSPQARGPAAPGPPPPPPPLRIAPYRPPAQEPPQTPGQIAADLRRVVDDPELAEWARMELWQRIRRLEDRQEALRRGELP